MRMRRKPNLTSRMEKCAHLLLSRPGDYRGSWLSSFGYDELHLEIGCGKGRFITATAAEHPGVFFVALEKTENVIITALENSVREEVSNVRYINAVAEKLPSYFAPDEVSCIYINFCDPWPSNKHRKRRLVGRDFLLSYRTFLKHGGQICFKTDGMELYDFALREFEICGFTLKECSRNLHGNGPAGIMTEYEQRFYEQGMPIYMCRAEM